MNITEQKIQQCFRILCIFLVLLTIMLVCVTIIEEKRKPLYTDTIIIFDEENNINRHENTVPITTLPATEIILTTKTKPTTTTTTTTTTKLKTTATTTTTTTSMSILNDSMVYNISAEERDMLARLLYLEGGSTSYKCQKMIMEVVFNHYEYRGRKSSFTDIVYTKNLFSPAQKIKNTKARQIQYDIVDEICRDGMTILPSYVLYFRASYHHSWATPYTDIDNVYFSYSKKDKK